MGMSMRVCGLLLMLAAVVATPVPAAPQASTSGPAALDYQFFKDRVQPIFLHKKPGNARCLVCHRSGAVAYLQPLSPGATTWDEEQSRKNFEAVKRFVVPGNPLKSKLLMHPLAEEAGGDDFHGGGHHWKSQDDPEWQALAAWVRGQKL
jgi:hypothetical protein